MGICWVKNTAPAVKEHGAAPAQIRSNPYFKPFPPKTTAIAANVLLHLCLERHFALKSHWLLLRLSGVGNQSVNFTTRKLQQNSR